MPTYANDVTGAHENLTVLMTLKMHKTLR